MTDENSVK